MSEWGALIMNGKQLAALIDHTLLKPETTAGDIEKLCMEARQYDFHSVCINPCYVKLAANLLSDSKIKVCTVIGFPLGANTSRQKQAEAEEAMADGAAELDMVIAIGALKSGDWTTVKNEIAAVRGVAGKGTVLKVILETALLSREEIEKACNISVEAGADFVKTSTGFGHPGATTEVVALLRAAVGPGVGVKASGGIRTLEKFLDLVKAGANRIGTSAGVGIMQEWQLQNGLVDNRSSKPKG